jgi:hypothetical protein
MKRNLEKEVPENRFQRGFRTSKRRGRRKRG